MLLVILLGIASRLTQSGSVLVDKYLGDALYALLGYLLLAACFTQRRPLAVALMAGLCLIAIESFQLTGIAQQLRQHGNAAQRLLALMLGTQFSWWDLVAYGVGVVVGLWLDWRYFFKTSRTA